MDTLTNSSGSRYSMKGKYRSYATCAIDNVLFVLILYVLVNIFSVMPRDGSYIVEPVLSSR